MEQINNDQTIKECSAVLGHIVQDVPMLDTSKISLVANINPKDLRRVNIVARVTNAGTIYTTPTDRDFYLVGTSLSGSNNIASKASIGTITVTPDGLAATVINCVQINTSAILDVANSISNIILPNPMKLTRGTNITLTTTDLSAKSAIIYGYITD